MTDGALKPAVNRLADAVSALCHPVLYVIDYRRRYTSSWYRQLQDATPGNQGLGGGQPAPGCWLDALMVLTNIDETVAKWQPAFGTTPERLNDLTETRRWRPQDCDQLAGMAASVESWVHEIKGMLAPVSRVPLPHACPKCKTVTTYRRDSAGDVVRTAALQVDANGCECMACHAKWGIDQLMFLGRLLRCEPVAGVIDAT